MTIACRRNDKRRLQRASSHMTNAMTKGMTKLAAPVEQFARRRLRFGFELRPPVAKRLERKPLSLTILSLIQIALTPRLVACAPKGLAVMLARAPFVRHQFLPTFAKKASENRSRSTGAKQSCNQWTLTKIPCYAS